MWAVALPLKYSSSVEVITTINPTIVLKHKMPPGITSIFFHIYRFSFITFKDKVEILIYVKKNRPKDIHTNLQLVLSFFKTSRVYFSKDYPPSQTVSKPTLLCKLNVKVASGAMTCLAVCVINRTALSSRLQDVAEELWSVLSDRKTISYFWQCLCYLFDVWRASGERERLLLRVLTSCQ